MTCRAQTADTPPTVFCPSQGIKISAHPTDKTYFSAPLRLPKTIVLDPPPPAAQPYYFTSRIQNPDAPNGSGFAFDIRPACFNPKLPKNAGPDVSSEAQNVLNKYLTEPQDLGQRFTSGFISGNFGARFLPWLD